MDKLPNNVEVCNCCTQVLPPSIVLKMYPAVDVEPAMKATNGEIMEAA
jgi:hypothetical protein